MCASSWTVTKNHCMMQVNKTLDKHRSLGRNMKMVIKKKERKKESRENE